MAQHGRASGGTPARAATLRAAKLDRRSGGQDHGRSRLGHDDDRGVASMRDDRGPVGQRGGRGLAGQRDRLRAIIEPVLRAHEFDLEELRIVRAGRRQVVRVVVDSDSGVSLDGVAALSREISAALDAAEESGRELIAGEYTLEVTSPGVDRPLTQPRHWRRNVGRLVTVRVGQRQLTGRVSAADEHGVRLEVAGERIEVGYAELGPGRVQLDFSRAATIAANDSADESASDDFEEDEE